MSALGTLNNAIIPRSKFSRVPPFPVFRFLHMDYVTRQFINLAKKLRKEVREALEVLHRDFQKHTEAIHKASEASNQRETTMPILRAQLQIPETPI